MLLSSHCGVFVAPISLVVVVVVVVVTHYAFVVAHCSVFVVNCSVDVAHRSYCCRLLLFLPSLLLSSICYRLILIKMKCCVGVAIEIWL